MLGDIMPFYNTTDKVLVKSKDCYLYDKDGRKYLDLEAGVWCANIGHNNDQLAEKVNSLVRESVHQGYLFRNEYAERLSQKLQKLVGFENGSSVFLCSGSEAVNLSITLARHLTGRKKVLKIDNSYLSSFGFGQISGENEALVAVRYNDMQAIDDIDFGEISAFVVETGGASIEAVRFPGNEFINRLISESAKNGCLVIAEEVTTGMGRTGKWFGFQNYDFIPDMLVTGKALGNGFPISGLTVNADIAARFLNNPFHYSQSHQNDPFGCAVALEVINFIEENNLLERVNRVGDYFKNQLEGIKQKYPDKVKDIRARGLMLALELEDTVDGESINAKYFEAGFVNRFKLNTFRFLPPLTIKESDIDEVVKCLDNLLSE